MSKKNKSKNKDEQFFWETAGVFLNHELPDIRKKSPNTVASYRSSLNIYIDYLENIKGIGRTLISFRDFNKENLKDYLLWMDKEKRWNSRTSNLRIAAIRTLLSFASEESADITPTYMGCKSIKNLSNAKNEIEYFEDYQLAAILKAPEICKKSERRNHMMLIVGYDIAVRVGELITLKVGDFRLDADVPYVRILGKGSKYRSVPLMKKTIAHLRKYLNEFHLDTDLQKPLFYTVTHGMMHGLSDDTVQNVLKKYASQCESDGIHMPSYVHFHMLRKSRAMNLYKAGCPLSYIQQMLGHESFSTTSGFYAFATLESLEKAIEKANPTPDNAEKLWKDEDTIKRLYRL